MPSHQLTSLLTLGIAGTLLLGSPLRADQVTLQDGKVLTGEITAEDDRSLTLRLSDSNSAITLSRRIGKAQVKSVTRPQRLGPPYVLIPVNGEIGRDATTASLQAGFAEADKVAPNYIILDIDSKGGSVRELYGMLDVVADAQRNHQVIAYVHNAYSAAAVLAMACRQIYVAPTGVIGAALPIKLTRNGPADVEAKFRSAIEAKQRTYVAAAGHDPLLLSGMIQLDAEIYLSLDPAGHPLLTPEGPGKRIKSKGTILTLTAAEAAECGLARVAPDLADVGQQLTAGPWHEATRAPWDAAVATAASQRRIQREAAEARDRTLAAAEAFERAKPEIDSNQRRIDDLAAKLDANETAIRDLRRQFDSDVTAAEADFEARTRGAFQNDVLIARGQRDARIADLRNTALADLQKLNVEGDALQQEYKQLRARQRDLLASVTPD